MVKKFKPLNERLHGLITEVPIAGCWLFTGKLDKDGYGSLHNRSGGGDYKAHRLSWELAHGKIPEGKEIAHHCDVRCCVNPSHLYVATHQQNIADRTKRNRLQKGELCSWSKVNEETVVKIRNGELKKEDVNLSRSQFYRIKSGENWSHVDS